MMGELASAYKSGCQSARIVTETWGAANFYCPNCSSPKLDWLKTGYKVHDYRCPSCGFFFQLKSQRAPIRNSVPDGAYRPMIEAIRKDKTPNFYFMQYNLETWSVKNLLLVPHFAFPPSAIIKRNPTTPKGRSQPWVGCSIALNRIPSEARISIVTESKAISPSEVREQFKRVKPIGEIKGVERGWLLEVLNVVNRLGKAEFSNQEVYAFASELKQLHPQNDNINAKIRQKLQELRDRNLLLHVGRNCWRLPD